MFNFWGGHFSCLKRIVYDVVPLLEGPKFTPDAGTVPIGPRGTVRFLKEMNLKKLTRCKLCSQNFSTLSLMKFSLPHLWCKGKKKKFLTTAHARLDKPAAIVCQSWQSNAYHQQSRYKAEHLVASFFLVRPQSQTA